MYGLIDHNGRICQIADVMFPVSPALTWVDVPSGTSTQDAWSGTQVVKHIEPVVSEQEVRRPAAETIQGLKREQALAEIAADQVRSNKIRREISRIKFMSQGV